MAEAHPIPTDPRFHNLTGKKFGRLTVLSYAGRNKSKSASLWNCACRCGGTSCSAGSKLTSGHTKSCGCIAKTVLGISQFKHGLAHRIPEYHVWKEMRRRCRSKSHPQYPDYGGRGITICQRWLDSFANFIADMGRRPSSKYGIDRINNDGNYEPGNCRWATAAQQGRNKRNNVFLTHNGKTMCLSAWAEEIGVTCCTVRARIHRGNPINDVLSKTPLHKGRRR